MFKFFRRTRSKALEESKVIKYLKYAIGEIILVVIGILIALQINNWNEDKKTRKLELSILKEMVENLEADIEDMEINKAYHERGIESANIILSAFENNQAQHDSLNKHYGKVSLIPKYLRSETAYTSMKEKGTRIVKNDSLRLKITSYYEISSQYLMDWNDAEWNVQFQDSRDISRKYFKKFEVFRDLVPEDYNALSNDKAYRNYLNNRIGWLNVTVALYRNRITGSKELIETIEDELMRRDPTYKE